MQDMQETYYLTSVEQIKIVADPLRLRIVDMLTYKAMTTTQLGEALGETSAKTHYHVHALERIGIIRLVETREKGGILEKYYLATAKSVSIAPEVLNTAPADEITMILHEYFRIIEQEATKAFKILLNERDINSEPPPLFQLATSIIRSTPEEMKNLLHDINTLTEKYQAPRGIEGEQEWSMALIAHPLLAAPLVPVTEPAVPATSSAKVKPSHFFTLGALSLNRAELEERLAKGRQIDLNVIGICAFANDVTPDLIERAISRFRHRGILTASPEVREALKRKNSI